MRVVVSHPTTQHAYETAYAAHEAGRLTAFFTSFFARINVERASEAGGSTFYGRVTRSVVRRSDPRLIDAPVRSFMAHHAIARLLADRRHARLRADRAFDRRVAAELLALRPDIFHGFEGFCLASLQSATRVGARTVLDVASFHEQAVEFERQRGNSIPDWHTAAVLRERARADALVVPTAAIRDFLAERGVPPARVHVIPYGVDVTAFSPAATAPPVFRALFAGGVRQRKGVQELLAAWDRLQLPEAELVLVGAPDAWGRHALDERRSSVQHLGNVPKALMPALYRQASVLLLPSHSESWGLVVTEAMASGLPVIVSDRVGAPVENGSNGLVVPVGDVDALAHAIHTIYSDATLASRMGQSGRSMAEALTWGNYRQRIRALHDQLSRA